MTTAVTNTKAALDTAAARMPAAGQRTAAGLTRTAERDPAAGSDVAADAGMGADSDVAADSYVAAGGHTVAGRRCELCGEGRFEPLARQDRRGDRLETVVCCHCGLVSHAEIPTVEALRDYYSRKYRRDYHGEFTPSPYRVVREWQRAARLLSRLRPFVAQGSRVLEVGSGIGCNVKQFELSGYEASGIEPGEGFCQFSREQLRASVSLQSLEDLDDSPTRDLVLLVHVLEHLPHPRQALRRIHGLLKPGGLLYVEVPNYGLPHAAPGRVFHYAHIYNFTRPTLEGIAAVAGFEPVHHFLKAGGKELAILFRAVDPTSIPTQVDPAGYQLVAAVRQLRAAAYYLRRRYLMDRIRHVWRYARQRWTAKREFARILRICQSGTPATVRRAAARTPAQAEERGSTLFTACR